MIGELPSLQQPTSNGDGIEESDSDNEDDPNNELVN